MKGRSLRRLLAGGVLLANSFCLAGFSALAISHEMHGRRRGFDALLLGRAESVLAAAERTEGPDGKAPRHVSSGLNGFVPPAEDLYVLFEHSGEMQASVQTAPGLSDVLRGSDYRGPFDFTWRGRRYRAVRLQGSGGTSDPLAVVYASPTGDLHHEAVEAIWFDALVALAVLAVTSLALHWFLRQSLYPLQALADRAALVTPDSWQFQPPVSALRTAELEPIASAIQVLVRGLREAFERQKQFTDDAAHEWKTSVAVLKSGIQLLSMRPRSLKEYQSALADFEKDVRRMEDLTEQMLLLARLEQKGEEVQEESVDFAGVMQATAQRLRPIAETHGVQMSVHSEPELRIAMNLCDSQILCSNLLLNALQHGVKNTVVTAALMTAADGITFRVTNKAEGVAESALPHVFDRFYRVDSSRSRASGGTGLGLAICKAIVQRSGGTIEMRCALDCVLDEVVEVLVRFPSARRRSDFSLS